MTFGGFVAMALTCRSCWSTGDLSLTDAGLRAAGFTLLAPRSGPVGGMLGPDRW